MRLAPKGRRRSARIEVAEDERERARARREAPALPTLPEDDGRDTAKLSGPLAFDDDDETKVKDAGDVRAEIERAKHGKTRLAPRLPPPHRPPSRRSTLLEGMGGAPPPAVVLVQGYVRRGERVMTRFCALAASQRAEHCNGETCKPAHGRRRSARP
jgi:hypothetical protein